MQKTESAVVNTTLAVSVAFVDLLTSLRLLPRLPVDVRVDPVRQRQGARKFLREYTAFGARREPVRRQGHDRPAPARSEALIFLARRGARLFGLVQSCISVSSEVFPKTPDSLSPQKPRT